MSDQNPGDRHEAHNFLVTEVSPADVRDRIAVTLTDARGGRVTLHLDEALAARLCDLIEAQVGAAGG